MDGQRGPRDRFGFLIQQDYLHLAKIYAPLYEREEEDRVAAWHLFLEGAAAQLGIQTGGAPAPTPPAAAAQKTGFAAAAASHAAAPAAALAAAAIPRILDEPAAAALAAQLTKMVHGGIPTGLRAVIWPLLLRSDRGAPAGRYEALVKAVEAVEASGAFSSPCYFESWGRGGGSCTQYAHIRPLTRWPHVMISDQQAPFKLADLIRPRVSLTERAAGC